MKKTLLLAAAVMIASATLASAGTVVRGELTLGWDNCRANGGGVLNKTFACNTNSGQGPLLVGGFIPNANANLNSLNSAFLHVDVFNETAALDPWWTFTDPPVVGCRQLSVWQLNFDNAPGAVCDAQYWGDVGNPVAAARFFYPSYAANHGTLRWLTAVDAQVAQSTPQIPVGAESYVFGVRLGRALTTGAGACAGCLNRTCLYFALAEFFQTNLDNFNVGEVGGANIPQPGNAYVGWQLNGAETGCGTPVRNATWGSIKSLYR